MKLSKKIVGLFVITSFLTVLLYIASSNVLLKYMYGGEVRRVSGIFSHGVTALNTEVSKLSELGNDYKSLVEASNLYNKKIGSSNGLEELNIDKKFARDGIDYVIIIDSNKEQVYFKEDKNISQESKKGFENVYKIIKGLIESKKDYVNGIINEENIPYITYIDELKSIDSKNKEGYIILIDALDNKKISKIGNSINKELILTSNITMDGQVKNAEFLNGIEFTLVMKGKEVDSYYKIPKIQGDKEFYLRLSEPSIVKNSTQETFLVVSALLIVITLIVNILLLLLIKKLVIKRIERINRGINKIKDSKDLSDRIEEELGNDEITILSKDINHMFKSLEDSNKLLLSKENKYSKLIDSLENGYAYFKISYNEKGIANDAYIVEVNDALSKMIKEPKENLISRSIKEIFLEKVLEVKDINNMLRCIGKEGQAIVRNSVKVSDNTWAYLSLYTVEEGYFALVLTDISENKKFADEMRYLANYDVLTNLQNRYSLYNYMAQLKEDGESFNIYFIDLDNFKTLNDTLGHNTGDEVLCTAAQVLSSIKEEEITIGRLGGDEFLLVVRGDYNEDKVKKLGDIILRSLNTTFKYRNYSYELKASVGGSSFPKDTDDIETLLKYADIAMYKSKQGGGNKFKIFSTEMLEEIIIETELKKSIKNKEFTVYYQPIYNVSSDEIVGAEALIRWIKDGEIVAPLRFIPIAKKTGDITEIDIFVLEEACIFCKKKRLEGHKNFQVSVNSSYRLLKQHNFVDKLKEILKKNDLDPSGLKLEITEDEVLDDVNHVVEILGNIKALGVKVALDDFGVGYSSFSYIKILPIDTIKIDRSLLLEIEDDKKTLAIITTLIQLAHTLELDVIAEGVEINAQLELLKGLECDKVQGYIISRPVPENEFNNIIN